MDRDGLKKIFRLLTEAYPNQSKPDTSERFAAWLLILEPYTYEQVKAAVLAHSRDGARGIYYPTAPELASRISDEKKDGDAATNYDHLAWMDEFLDKQEPLIPCQILDRDCHGTWGEIMRRNVPRGCVGCRRLAETGTCIDYEKYGGAGDAQKK